jgi:hypothetical protein
LFVPETSRQPKYVRQLEILHTCEPSAPLESRDIQRQKEFL